MTYDAIIAGGGMAGLSAAAFLCKAGRKILLCEKEEALGGLVGSFDYKGFVFDSGIRAVENSGVLFPMLKSLGLDMAYAASGVSIGIGDAVVRLTSEDSLKDYRDMLVSQFPQDAKAIDALMEIIKQTMVYMRVLYGIDNPLFLDLKKEMAYVRKTLLPWMFKYITTIGKINRLNMPVETYLKTVISNRALVDIIAQHFFAQTPAYFALSYFSLYLDYNYPKGGTGTLVKTLSDYILQRGGTIITEKGIKAVRPAERTVTADDGSVYSYGSLVWCADAKALYSSLSGLDALRAKDRVNIDKQRALISGKLGGDSVLTLYLTADIDKSYFGNISSPHFFYTPQKKGLGALPASLIRQSDGQYSSHRGEIFDWVRSHLQLTTYEISLPVLRDETLAPQGKTGLIISALMDYSLVSHIRDMGWYDDFKALCREEITAVLTDSVYPQLREKVIDGFVSTPLTIESRTGNTGGAITGWAFTNRPVPAVSKLTGIAKAVRTPVPHVFQAGQWTYSPSGFPISILTGKLAADQVIKDLK